VGKYGAVRQATDDNIAGRMQFSCWITKATEIHSEYVILTGFPRQQWLRERASMLRYSTLPVLFSAACFFPVGMSYKMTVDLWELTANSTAQASCLVRTV
jgi:hypothetical protein